MREESSAHCHGRQALCNHLVFSATTTSTSDVRATLPKAREAQALEQLNQFFVQAGLRPRRLERHSTYPGQGPSLYLRLHFPNIYGQVLTLFSASKLLLCDFNCVHAMFLVYNNPGNLNNVLAMHLVSNSFVPSSLDASQPQR